MSARWYVKKVARQGMALGSWATGSLKVRDLLPSGPGVRALTYHRFADDEQDAFCLNPDDFEAQVRFLAERRLAVSLRQVQEFVAGRATLPEGACLITIDDGFLTTLTEALPILRRWGVPAVAYVTANLIGRDYDGMPERYMTWDELRELNKSGLIAIGSHAHSHVSLGLLDPEEARQEAIRSKEVIEAELGETISSFGYPFGTRKDFNPVTERALADAGYELAFNSMHGVIRAGMDPISLPRVKVEGGEGLWMFRLICRGAMDPWRAVDQNLWRLQRVRQEVR